MTKKDYIRAAELIRRSGQKKNQDVIIDMFVSFFWEDNPKFSSERFRAAATIGMEEASRLDCRPARKFSFEDES